MDSDKKGLEGLGDIWNIVRERRLETYGCVGVLVFHRDDDGVVQERYYPTSDKFSKVYNRQTPVPANSLVIDLSGEVE